MVCFRAQGFVRVLDVLLSLKRSAPIDFELIAVNLDQKQPDFPAEVLPNYLRALGVPFHVIEQDTYSVVKRVIPEGKTMCACARGCGAERCTAMPAKTASPRLPSASPG